MSERRVLRSRTQGKAQKTTTRHPDNPKKGHGRGVRTSPHRTRLLSLPPEIRNKIYKAVVETDLILLYDKFWYPKAPCWPPTITTWPACFNSMSISPEHGTQECTSQYQHERKRKKSAGALSWLRTNRQVHTEAQSIVYQNLNVHVTDQFALAALLFPREKSTFKFAGLRSLSVCLPMPIITDGRDGFLFAREGQFRGWRNNGHDTLCTCVLCNIFRNGDVTDILPGLRNLELLVSFVCIGGNTRPVLGHFGNGNPRYGMLYRPKNPSPLVYTGDKNGIDGVVREFRRQQPMACFHGRMGKGISLDIRFRMEKVQHDPENVFSHPADRKCWCMGRSIDEESLRDSGLLSRLKAKLEEGGVDAWKSFKHLGTLFAT
ncbi:hypothetical protein DL98DRAFT_512935 [Cadophora sp. DSE1049]|nr:hypothetical protein DL98DRAFT_512935 [Cadophora sp. DSE1049]